MYGMVNRAIEDLVVTTGGEEMWQKVIAVAGVETGQFSDSEIYDDEVTFKLVAAASEVTGQPTDAILEAFGRHWILYTGREGWASLFEVAGDNLYDFLTELDALHARVQLAMPGMQMPQFTVVNTGDDGVIVEYRSVRTGFAPMVSGLLAGLAEYFDESVHIEQIGWRTDDGHDSFQLTQAGKNALIETEANAA